MEPPAEPVPECRYCGRRLRKGNVCAEHRELERADPTAIAEGPPLSEGQLGGRSPFKVPRRAGRRELY